MKKEEKKKIKISQMTDYLKFLPQFKRMTEEEKKLFICQSKNIKLLEMFITNDEDKIECYYAIYRDDMAMYLNKLYEVLMNTTDDIIKYKYVAMLQDEDKKKAVILSISDLLIRGGSIEFLNDSNQNDVISTIKDDEALKQIYFNTKNIKVFCAIVDDDAKQILMRDFSLEDQVRVICSLRDDARKYQYTRDGRFQTYLADITKSIGEFGYVRRIFSEHTELMFKLDVIDHTQSLKEFNELVGMLPDSIYKELFFISRKQNKDIILKQMEVDKKSVDTNAGLTFQISFEINIDNVPELMNFSRIFDNWAIEGNMYSCNQLKITSPRLSYSPDGFKEVKYVCDLLERYNCMPVFGTNKSIKFNFDYFNSLEHFFNFIKMYGYSEEVIRWISNSMGVNGANNGILEFRLLLIHIISQGACLSQNDSLYGYVNEMNRVTDCTNYSLNLTDCCTDGGMLEFKIPNNELNFNDIKATIILFAKLLEKAKLVTIIGEKNDILGVDNKKELLRINRQLLVNCGNEQAGIMEIFNVLNDDTARRIMTDFTRLTEAGINMDERLELLLKFLFNTSEERQIYRDRYYGDSGYTRAN